MTNIFKMMQKMMEKKRNKKEIKSQIKFLRVKLFMVSKDITKATNSLIDSCKREDSETVIAFGVARLDKLSDKREDFIEKIEKLNVALDCKR